MQPHFTPSINTNIFLTNVLTGLFFHQDILLILKSSLMELSKHQ